MPPFLFLRPWVIFTLLTLASFPGTLPVSASVSCSSGVLSCFFEISQRGHTSHFLCLWSVFLRLQDCGSCFCCLPPSWWGWSRGLTGLLLGGAAARPRGVGLGLVSLAAELCQRVCLEVAVGSGRHSAACLSVSRPVFPPAGWLFWGVPAPEPAGCWGGQARGWPPGELMPMSGPWSLCHQRPRPPQRATASPHVPRTPEACRWFWPRFPGSRCLAPDPNARETLLSTCS